MIEEKYLIKHGYLNRKERRKRKLKGQGLNSWIRKVENVIPKNSRG